MSWGGECLLIYWIRLKEVHNKNDCYPNHGALFLCVEKELEEDEDDSEMSEDLEGDGDDSEMSEDPEEDGNDSETSERRISKRTKMTRTEMT